jgi:glycosyltransferase involved in cell wall biosynthesis
MLHSFLFSNISKAKIITHTIHRDPKKYLLLFRNIDRIYSGTDSIIEDAKILFPKLSDLFKSIYNCIDFKEYKKPSIRQRDGKIKFLFIGRFSKDKGLESFITAFCEAAKENVNIYFETIGPMKDGEGGDSHLLRDMENLVHQMNLSDRFQFHQPVFERKALDDEIKKADVVVLPSINGETLNMSILECMRLGKPFLISDLPANMPLIIEGDTGFFVNRGNIVAWKAKILEIASDIDRIEQWGKNSFDYGKSTFSCEIIAQLYINDFNEILTHRLKSK